MRDRWRLLLAAALALTGVALLVFVLRPMWPRLGEHIEAARALDERWVFLVALFYLPFCALFLPGSWVTLFCCLVWGFWPTFPAIVLASNLGAALAFFLGRTLLGARVSAWCASRPKLAAVRQAIGPESLHLVALLRLTPLVPFNALNYVLGVTPVRLRAYALGTFLGMLPGTALNCAMFAGVRDFADILAGNKPPDPLGIAGLVLRIVVTVLATVLITRRARAALAAAVR
jgi:uncharacterized membrane protein YdjX (TVP38/TMEM64 family)